MLGLENGIGQDVRSDDAMAQRCQFNSLFILNRTMEEEPGQLDVDLTILDYLLFKSTESMLNARMAELDETEVPNRESPEIKIEMTHGAYISDSHINSKSPSPSANLRLILQAYLYDPPRQAPPS
jgi:hypothetical protein